MLIELDLTETQMNTLKRLASPCSAEVKVGRCQQFLEDTLVEVLNDLAEPDDVPKTKTPAKRKAHKKKRK